MTRTTAMSDAREDGEPTDPGFVDNDATVIEVARFRRRELPLSPDAPPEEPCDESTDRLVLADEPTLIVRAPQPGNAPASRPLSLSEVFAEPPALPRDSAPAEDDAPPDARARRKRKLLLLFVMLAGAWVTVRPQAEPAPIVTSRIVSVEPAEARRPPGRLPAIATPETVDIDTAATELAAGRYPEALAQYQELAYRHPERPVFALIASILRSELRELCASGAQEGCP